MSINTYEQNRILNASPMELVRILYAAAVTAVQDARGYLRAGDIAGRSKAINRAQMIVVELANSVDRTQSAEIGGRLVALYDYMLNRLAEANVEQKDAPLAEVIELLTVLQEGWSQVADQTEPALAAR
jgi:flagellar secretion chaperone FliS